MNDSLLSEILKLRCNCILLICIIPLIGLWKYMMKQSIIFQILIQYIYKVISIFKPFDQFIQRLKKYRHFNNIVHTWLRLTLTFMDQLNKLFYHIFAFQVLRCMEFSYFPHLKSYQRMKYSLTLETYCLL